MCAVVSCHLLPARDVVRARTAVSSHLLHSRAAPTVVRTRILRLVSCHLLHVRGAPTVVQQPCKQHQHTQDPSALTSPSGRARRAATAAAATLSHKSHISHNTNLSYSRQGSDGSRTSSGVQAIAAAVKRSQPEEERAPPLQSAAIFARAAFSGSLQSHFRSYTRAKKQVVVTPADHQVFSWWGVYMLFYL